uniref:Uncharacterized protein n=1 Tax=Clastoptera arizonana TaxID=38151 RepID=A0A1B6CZX0_9HEMI
MFLGNSKYMLRFVSIFLICLKGISSDYLYNVGIIIERQLEMPNPEDSQDLFDNISHYNTLLQDMVNNLKAKEPLTLTIAREFWARGIPGFINFVNLHYLRDEFQWDDEKTEQFLNLIETSKNLWSEITGELKTHGIFNS